jgi:branched-chain amino acid transport system permease protein
MFQAFFVDPFIMIYDAPLFFVEVLVSGLMAGVMYSLVALGFVIIFKASGVFNLAQGAMVLFAALTFVGLWEMGVNPWLSLILSALVMIGFAFSIERIVLRPLVNQDPIIFFMATLGITYFLDGFGQTIWGGEVRPLDIGIPNEPFMDLADMTGLYINKFDVFSAVVCSFLVVILAGFFTKTKIGRALRAVADDHQAALSVGIPLKTIWTIVWSVAGIVGLAAGILWGSKLGVQFALSLIAFKALPVLILGGFTSIPGAILGGLIIGSGEKIAEVYWGEAMGGAIEDWFAYVVALIFLLFRPQGLFGEKIIERV